MAEGGQKLAAVLGALKDATKAGVTTLSLDKLAREHIVALGAKPAFLNYRPHGATHAYPYTLCTSPNSVVVHGQPSKYVLKNGDIISLDLGLIERGYYLDAAITVAIGTVPKETKKLLATTREALELAIKAAKPGNTFGDVGAAVQAIVKKNKFSVVEGLTGHGIGKQLHEDPPVFNFGKPGEGDVITPGMVLAIEPMVAVGRGRIHQLKDESYGTVDGSLAAHFEHTVAITEKGPRVLTLLK